MRIIKSFALVILIGIAAVGLTVTSAKAATVQFDGTAGYVTGITNLVTDGAGTHNIAFVLGTYDDVFPSGFLFSNANAIGHSNQRRLKRIIGNCGGRRT